MNVHRGFCLRGEVRYETLGELRPSIGSGTLDTPTGCTTADHICFPEKGDYDAITESKM